MMIVPQVVLNPILESVNISASSVEPLKAEQKLFFEIPLGPIVQKIKLQNQFRVLSEDKDYKTASLDMHMWEFGFPRGATT